MLIWATYIDLREYRIPNITNIILFGVGCIYAIDIEGQVIWIAVSESMAIFLLFWIFSVGFTWMRGRIGLGFGDVKFVAALTPWVGLINIPVIIFVASLIGLIAIALNKTLQYFTWNYQQENMHKSKSASFFETKLPFAPFISLAGCMIFFASNHWSDNLLELIFTH
ncbi:MAG: prepilin peptidase [Hyphomicrobiales bacterium]|nr:prepilin peptidase [Hyphomicrobiales bacterium]